MATLVMMPILEILLAVVISRCECESTNGYSNSHGNVATQIGNLLKPPPLPPLSPIVPVPFHGGTGRIQRQNGDIGYQYQPPLQPLSAPSLTPTGEFKFPAPFYKQYNFNFVPPPQPFTTTPSPSIFQKVSGWLFPSKEVSYDTGLNGANNIMPLKKDCNPCNLVPWIPVLRYKVESENGQQSISPTYGPPSPTAFTTLQNIGQYRPQIVNTNSYDQGQQSFTGGVPHEVYGPPKQTKQITNSFASLSSTYGPPSPTHTVPILKDNPSNTLSLSSNSYDLSGSSYGISIPSIGFPSSSYGLPVSISPISSSTFRTPISSYLPASYDNNNFLSTTYSPITHNYYPEVLNKELPTQSDVEILEDNKPATELELPKVTSPTGFKNSYGEIITNTYALDIPYSVSATGAESNKIKTEVLPYDGAKLVRPNYTVALSNPAPFSLNRGRNIHTLQPVALPNLSVSPLPPIFNARPFRPISTHAPSNTFHSLNINQYPVNNVNVEQSVPIAEYTHSIEYPTTIVQSPIIDIDASKSSNQTKGYRNIHNSFVINEVRDISSQASEDHISAAKSQPDSSFETTGADYGNNLFEPGLPISLNTLQFPSNHKPDFADLSGLKDEDVDKYRTDSNLQNIDSPLLYLKPSAPHKTYENFVTVSTPGVVNEYEMYDDVPTTTLSPQQPTYVSAWDESRTYFSDVSVPREEHEEVNHGKVIQIIVPYTTGQKNHIESWPKNWKSNAEDFLARKIQSNTENYSFSTSSTTESNVVRTTTENPQPTVTENIDQGNTPAILNDLYDVKEPPFDIIKLQHNIDDWTEQEYSNTKYVRTPQRTRSNEKYAKQIPDDYFTTTANPVASYVTSTANYNYDFYDHEVSSSIQHPVTDNKNGSLTRSHKEYNSIERTKSNHNSGKNEEPDEIQKLHIYTAASSFRTSTTTPAPWSEIQTSISPLTKEKVYVVTSKPWRENPKAPEYEYELDIFESKKTGSDSTASESDDLPFKSPRFSHRPSFGFQPTAAQKQLTLGTSSKEWHNSINDLRSRTQSEHLSLFEDFDQKDNIYVDEDIAKKTAA